MSRLAEALGLRPDRFFRCPALDDGRNLNSDRVVRHAFQHYCIRPDQDVVADSDGAQQLGADTDVDVVSDHRRRALVDATNADDDTAADAAVVAEFRVAADDDPAEMVDHEIAPDWHLARQLDPSHYLDELEEDFIDQRKEFSQQRRADTVTPAAEAIDQQRPEALCAPVTPVRPEIAAYVLEHCRLNAWVACPNACDSTATTRARNALRKRQSPRETAFSAGA